MSDVVRGTRAATVRRDKLTPPLVPWFAVDRPALERRLAPVRTGKLVLISAPAGYGKSVLAAQYVARQTDLAVGWLHLDKGDNDAARLAAHLVAALGAGQAGFGAAALERLTVGTSGFGAELLDELTVELEVSDPVLLVLDELEAITDRALRADLLTLVRSVPRHVHVMAISRSDPRMPMHRLRLLDELVEIGERDLALSAEEVREVVRRVSGHELTDAQTGALCESTEGWPAGLQAAALALRESDDLDATIAGMDRGDHAIERLLTLEVLDGLDPQVEAFLLATSILPRMNGPLCDAVTGRQDSATLLEQLHQDALFLARVGDGSGWYRYHGLFRGVLRDKLRRTDPEAERVWLARAAAWHLADGDADAAASFLLAARDWPQVIQLVRSLGPSYFESGRAATVLGWLGAVPEPVRAMDPLLALEHASLSAMAGDSLVSERDLAALERVGALPEGYRMVVAAIRSTWIESHAPPEAVLKWSDDALAVLPATTGIPDVLGVTSPESIEAILRVSRSRAMVYQGDLGAGRAELVIIEERLLRDERTGPWLINTEASIAMIDAWTGHLRSSEERYHRAIRYVLAIASASHASASHAHLAMGQVLIERDELARAELMLAESAAFANQLRRPIAIALHAVLGCRLALALNEPERGLDDFDRLRAQGFAPFPPAVDMRTQAVHLQLLVAAGQGSKARRLLEGRSGHRPTSISGPMVGAAASVLVHAGQIDEARRWLEAAVIDPVDDRSRIEQAVWLAVVLRDDDPERSTELLAEALDGAELDGHVRLFLDGGSPVLSVLRHHFERRPSAFLRRLVGAAAAPTSPSAAANRTLIDPLSERELVVLGFLATRLSNAEISERLFVSVNTLKTHLRHVYAKLGVNDRRAALAEAEAIGLI